MNNVAKENKKREDFFKKSLDDFMQQYMSEETPENERIISYELRGWGQSTLETDGRLSATMSFVVEPYSTENTIWTNKKEWVNNGAYTCYIKAKKVNEEYEVERISMIPEHYEEFIAEFEKYKETLPEEKVETEVVQVEKQENYLAREKIETISNGIKIGSVVLLLLAISIILQVIRKRKK